MQKNALPETSPSPWQPTRAGIKCWVWSLLFGLAARWSFTLFGHHETGVPLAITITTATVGLGVTASYSMWRWIDGLDEFQRAMQLQALALVFPGFLLIVVGCDQLRVAGVISGVTWHGQEVGFTMLAVYGVAWICLWWRNR